jgi:glycosyltransferase involved in cell wall biosynthesis
MANVINNIYKNPKNFETLKKNAREYIMNNFTWSIYEKKLMEIIENILKGVVL